MRGSPAVAVVLVVLTACGIPVDSQPHPIVLEEVDPPEIQEPEPEELAAVSIYLVRDERLVRVSRDLPAPPGVERAIASLVGGVTLPELRAGLRTSIPLGTQVLGLRSQGSVVRIDLNREFASVGGQEEILAVAQIVLTATSFEGVDFVGFELEGVRTDVPVADGALSVDPVGPGDYAELLSP